MLRQVPRLFESIEVPVHGNPERNHYRLTPMGYMKPTWLTLDDYVMFETPDRIPWKKVALVNVRGYLDFYPRFLAYGLERRGAECVTANVDIPQLGRLRQSTTEMRATNMARFLREDAVDDLASAINKVSSGCDAVIFPAILGMYSMEPVNRLRGTFILLPRRLPAFRECAASCCSATAFSNSEEHTYPGIPSPGVNSGATGSNASIPLISATCRWKPETS